jgi:hypothetical protein
MRDFAVRPIASFLVAAATLTGCASRSATEKSPSSVTPSTIRMEGMGGTVNLHTVSAIDANSLRLLQPIAKVWAIMPVVYDSLGLPVNKIDQAGYVIGAENQPVRRQLGKMPLSRYIDCGSMQGGPSADSYEVNLTLLTTLRPSESGTTAFTVLQAMARPVSTRGDWRQCSSQGLLERRLAEALQKALR